nr:hypothetical protein GCM10020185_78820 [Pseudomonas brassicacearum subsp. brassicacearum]
MQLGWWGCVLGAQDPWWLLPVVIGLLAHLWLCPAPRAEMFAVMRVGLSGMLLDWSLGTQGLFIFKQTPLPLWLALLWLVFATGLRHSLAWAMRPVWRGVLLGLVGGPLAYCVGGRHWRASPCHWESLAPPCSWHRSGRYGFPWRCAWPSRTERAPERRRYQGSSRKSGMRKGSIGPSRWPHISSWTTCCTSVQGSRGTKRSSSRK